MLHHSLVFVPSSRHAESSAYCSHVCSMLSNEHRQSMLLCWAIMLSICVAQKLHSSSILMVKSLEP